MIVDTGSDDDTKKIAADFTSRVLDFDWIDDFAAARNFSFEQATMDYILWLDSGDILLPTDRAKLMELKNALSPDIDAVSMAYNVSFDANNNLTSSSRRLRLVGGQPVSAGLVSFTGSGVDQPQVVGTKTSSSPTGRRYRPRAVQAKSQIFERHIARGAPLRPADIFNYTGESCRCTRTSRGDRQYLQFLATDDVKPELALITLNNLATCCYMVGGPTKWECAKSLEFDVPRPEFSCRFGERFIAQEKFPRPSSGTNSH